MQVFRAQDMQRNVSAVQEAAMTEPVLITYHDRPRLVLMSIAEYARIRGREKVVGGIEDMDEGIAKAIMDIADESTDEDEQALTRGARS